MGMDVYGQNPKSEVGEYFRKNVWGWHPLWTYCVDVHPDLVGDEPEYGHTNDGYGLDEISSMELAEALRKDLVTGVAAEYVTARNIQLSQLEMPECKWCEGTGVRTDELGLEHGMPDRELEQTAVIVFGRERGYCNGCQGAGKTEHPATMYSLDVDSIFSFYEFLRDCGGFGIH